jgi:hypothetical protein
MATWKPSPSVPVQVEGGLTPLSGKYVYGENLAPAFNTAPTPLFIAMPPSGSGNDGTDVFTTG